MNTLLILGATSDMARASALAFARKGWNLLLAGRNMTEMDAIALDLNLRAGCSVHCLSFDACDSQSAHSFWDSLPLCPDAVLCAVGCLEDQHDAQKDMLLTERMLCANFMGLIPVLSMAANAFEARGKGLIIGISSVAGERGRASNYIYGASKAGLTTFLSGLRHRLTRSNVRVITVKPGFVATRMTEGMQLPALLTATPQQVAEDIINSVQNGGDVVYTRWYWRWIMLVVRSLPEFLFKRTKL